LLLFRNNDKLSKTVDSALRAYSFEVTPAPLLSLSLNFEALLHWYRDILTAEMSYFLDNAFEVPLLPCQ
jgi:hypothetical protein